MIKYILVLICLFLSALAFGEARIRVVFAENNLGQGEPVEVRLIPDDDALNFNLQKLKGQKLGNTLYIQRVSPLIKTQGSSYESSALVVFVNIPKGSELKTRLGDESIVFFWDDLTVRPTETKKEFTYTAFSIPGRKKILFWSLLILGLVGALGLSYYLYKIYDLKKKRNDLRQKLGQEFLGADNYHSVVEIWKKKIFYLNEFPELSDHFKLFEKKLFEYQFRPHLTEREMNEVMRAYRDFVTTSQGVLNGI